jgi:hypothetical protein
MWDYIKTIIFSLAIIVFFHLMFDYLKNKYTTPITKDIIGIQTQKYKNIINTLQQGEQEPEVETNMEDDLLQHALSEL